MRGTWMVAVFLWLAAGTTLAGNMAGAPDAPARHLRVAALGEVEAVPDVARLTLRVVHTAPEVSAAKAEVDRISNRILKAADGQKLKKADIRASHIRVAPEYEWQDGKRLLRGHRVERSIDLRLTEVERYAALVQALVDAGVTHIDQVHFELSQEEKLQLQALDRAIAKAQRKASAMARAAGVELGAVHSVQELGEVAAPVPMMQRSVALAAESGAAPMPLGTQTLSAQVVLVYVLK